MIFYNKTHQHRKTWKKLQRHKERLLRTIKALKKVFFICAEVWYEPLLHEIGIWRLCILSWAKLNPLHAVLFIFIYLFFTWGGGLDCCSKTEKVHVFCRASHPWQQQNDKKRSEKKKLEKKLQKKEPHLFTLINSISFCKNHAVFRELLIKTYFEQIMCCCPMQSDVAHSSWPLTRHGVGKNPSDPLSVLFEIFARISEKKMSQCSSQCCK